MAAASALELQAVAQVTQRLQALLERARTIKPETSVEPPLLVSTISTEVDHLLDDVDPRYDPAFRSGIVETAARRIFADLVSSIDIEDPAFVAIWNLLDIMNIAGDRGVCGPEPLGYLIEELLDSQTTAGCRIVFDYMESRASRLAAKDFHKKNIIFLRSCNELLRRLSRAEDAIFCGRVFFFLFQTYPLGDKSSVNLRGEFHTENITKFEETEQDGEKMEVDGSAEETAKAETPQPPSKPGQKAVPPPKPVKKTAEEVVLSTNELYPIFWRLQRDFSDPIRLHDADNFASFKKGLGHTLTKFKKTTVVQTRNDSDPKRGTKRKADDEMTEGGAQDHFSENYNPKYLTSRDLFDLELSDLSFQRHILVQAWILIDFLLSLTEKAKKKLAAGPEVTNKALLYAYTLSEADAKWCLDTKQTIMDYLQSIPVRGNGRFYHRMVETILARDKNWVRWKLENCPSIVRDPVPAEQELEARNSAKNATRPRRIPDRPPGSVDLSFLEEGKGGGREALKNPARFSVPSVQELVDGVQNDKLDLEMAMDDEEKRSLENAVSNKKWRALRLVRATNLRLLDKVEPGKDIEDVFKAPPTPPPDAEASGEVNGTMEVDAEVEAKNGEETAESREGGEAEEGGEAAAGGETGESVQADQGGKIDAPAVTITDGEQEMQGTQGTQEMREQAKPVDENEEEAASEVAPATS
jgi:THO complex subunit 1